MLILPVTASAEKEFNLQVNPKTYPLKKFRKKNTSVKRMTAERAHPDALPSKERREKVFSRVPNLATHIEKLDQLDRDMLYMRARNDSPGELKNKYPDIPEETLLRLKKEAKKE
jgi:hypothetical protein